LPIFRLFFSAARARGELLELNWPLIDAIEDAPGLLEHDPLAGHVLRGPLQGSARFAWAPTASSTSSP